MVFKFSIETGRSPYILLYEICEIKIHFWFTMKQQDLVLAKCYTLYGWIGRNMQTH